MALGALALEAVIVRVLVTCNAVVMRDICKCLKFLSIFRGHLMAFFAVNFRVLTSELELSQIVIEL